MPTALEPEPASKSSPANALIEAASTVPQSDVTPTDVGKEALDAMKQNAIGHIASADSKATGLLAVSGALLALLVALAGATSEKGTPESFAIQCGFAAFAGCLSLSVAASALVLLPRTSRTALLQQGATVLPSSPTYFGEVRSLDDCKRIATKTTREELSRDYVEQVFVIALIAKTKLRWMQRSVWLLLVSLAILLVVILVKLSSGDQQANQNRASNPPETAKPTVSSDTVGPGDHHAEQDRANNPPEQIAQPAASSNH